MFSSPGHSFGVAPRSPPISSVAVVLRHVSNTFELIAEFGSWPQRSAIFGGVVGGPGPVSTSFCLSTKYVSPIVVSGTVLLVSDLLWGEWYSDLG